MKKINLPDLFSTIITVFGVVALVVFYFWCKNHPSNVYNKKEPNSVLVGKYIYKDNFIYDQTYYNTNNKEIRANFKLYYVLTNVKTGLDTIIEVKAGYSFRPDTIYIYK